MSTETTPAASEHPTECIEAWSLADDDDSLLRRTWRSTWGHAAIVLSLTVATAALIAAAGAYLHHESGRVGSQAPTTSVTVTNVMPAPPEPVRKIPQSVPDVQPANLDQRFLALVASVGLPGTITTDAAMIKGAHDICAEHAQGRTVAQISQESVDNDIDLKTSVAFTNSAISVYCPDATH